MSKRNNSDPEASIEGEIADPYEYAQQEFVREDIFGEYENKSKPDRIREILHRAIERGYPGFEVGKHISVSAAASSFKVNRATVAEAIRPFVESGQIRQASPTSPYEIIARAPVLPPPEVLADAAVAKVTVRLGKYKGGDLVAKLREIRRDDPDDVGPLLTERLKRSTDKILKTWTPPSAPLWTRQKIHIAEKLRFVLRNPDEGGHKAWWVETAFLFLPEEMEKRLGDLVDLYIARRHRWISFTWLLEQCGVKEWKGGHALVSSTANLPKAVERQANRLTQNNYLNDALKPIVLPTGPLVTWEFPIVAAEPNGVVAYVLSYLDAEVAHAFSSDFRFSPLEMNGPDPDSSGV